MKTLAGSAVYAKLDGDPRLFTMPIFLQDLRSTKSSKDLRDEVACSRSRRMQLSRIEITAQKQTYEFVKKGESEWQIVKPGQGHARG